MYITNQVLMYSLHYLFIVLFHLDIMTKKNNHRTCTTESPLLSTCILNEEREESRRLVRLQHTPVLRSPMRGDDGMAALDELLRIGDDCRDRVRAGGFVWRQSWRQSSLINPLRHFPWRSSAVLDGAPWMQPQSSDFATWY